MPGCQEPGAAGPLEGTVKPYGRHVLVCTGRRNWLPRVEDGADLLATIVNDVNALADRVDPKPKATALDTAPVGEGVDILVQPDGVAYRGVDAAAWARIRDEHVTHGRVVDALAPERLDGADVLVCAHASRDARCGACGPLLIPALRAALAGHGFAADAPGERRVRVHASSHVGGHKFAGNVIVYPQGAWYGYVTPANVGEFVDAHFVRNETWTPHLRGFGALTKRVDVKEKRAPDATRPDTR